MRTQSKCEELADRLAQERPYKRRVTLDLEFVTDGVSPGRLRASSGPGMLPIGGRLLAGGGVVDVLGKVASATTAGGEQHAAFVRKAERPD